MTSMRSAPSVVGPCQPQYSLTTRGGVSLPISDVSVRRAKAGSRLWISKRARRKVQNTPPEQGLCSFLQRAPRQGDGSGARSTETTQRLNPSISGGFDRRGRTFLPAESLAMGAGDGRRYWKSPLAHAGCPLSSTGWVMDSIPAAHRSRTRWVVTRAGKTPVGAYGDSASAFAAAIAPPVFAARGLTGRLERIRLSCRAPQYRFAFWPRSAITHLWRGLARATGSVANFGAGRMDFRILFFLAETAA